MIAVIRRRSANVYPRVGAASTQMSSTVPVREDVLVSLLRETGRGDEDAFAGLYDATRSRVFGLTLRILRDPKAAEEAALDAYWAVWRRAPDYDPSRGAPMGVHWIVTEWLSNRSCSRAA